jgi:hypothetical protein
MTKKPGCQVKRLLCWLGLHDWYSSEWYEYEEQGECHTPGKHRYEVYDTEHCARFCGAKRLVRVK